MRKILMMTATLLLAACQQGPSPEQLAKEKAEKMKYEADIAAWRSERIERLKKPDGWLSLVGMHWLPAEGFTRVGSGADNGTRLATGRHRLPTRRASIRRS